MRNQLFVVMIVVVAGRLGAQEVRSATDYVVRSYPVTAAGAFDENSLNFLRRMACDAEPFKSANMAAVEMPDSTIVHKALWEQKSGLFALLSSEWFIYERKKKGDRCSVRQVGVKADGSLALYGKRSARFLAFNSFRQPVDPRTVSVVYKISATPDVPQNVQDLGALIAGLLGATLPGGTAGGGMLGFRVAPPPETNTLITLAQVTGTPRLPFYYNITQQFSPLSSASLPPGKTGVPYSASLAPVGGSGTYRYALIEGSLPPGLTLNTATGAITGTPTAPGQSFTVQVADDADPPKVGISALYIKIDDTIELQLVDGNAAEKQVEFPLGSVGSFYSVTVRAKGGEGPLSYSIEKGMLPDGLYLDAVSGTISGIPRLVGKTTLTVAAAQGAKQGRLQTAIGIVPTESIYLDAGGSLPLADGFVGVPYRSVIAMNMPTGSEQFALKRPASSCTNMQDDANVLPGGLQGRVMDDKSYWIEGVTQLPGPVIIQLCAKPTPQAPTVSYQFHFKIDSGTLALMATAGVEVPQGGNRGQNPGGGTTAPGANQANQNQGRAAQQSQNTGNNNNSSSQQAVDCAAITATASPCTLTRRIRSDDREAFDFSIGISVPGVNERVYSSPTSSSIVRHTDLQVIANIYPFARWANKETWAPHFDVGLPVTGRVFYRPFFGIAETLTTWTGAERAGFPLRLGVFAGFVDMKERIATRDGLPYRRTFKPIFGIEIPVGALASKLSGGGKAQGQTSSKGGGKGGS